MRSSTSPWPATRARPATLLLLAWCAGCGHGDPFSFGNPLSDQPLNGTAPVQLTYGGGGEVTWLGDGTAIVFSGLLGLIQRPDSTRDTCIALIPSGGGQSRRAWCQPGLPQLDSIDAFEYPAVSPGGRLVFLHSSQLPIQVSWARRELVLTTLDSPDSVRHVLATLPQFGIPPHNGLVQMQWLDEQRFVYRADDIAYSQTRPPKITPLFIMLASISGDSATFAPVPGTDSAASVAVLGPDTLLYTLPHDPRVHRRILSSGATDIAWGADSAKTIHAAGGRLAAIVTPVSAQEYIVVVNLSTMQAQTVAFAKQFDGIALSPDGKSLVATRGGNLYRYAVP